MTLAAVCPILWSACASKKPQPAKTITTLDLDSLHRVEARRDSVESNTIFYEQAYEDYRRRFPGVDKKVYLHVAKGKDQDFCLFKPDPAQTCLTVGDKFNDLNLKEPAKDAYQAGLVSEGANDSQINMRLWASMGQLSIEEKDYDMGRFYVSKVLEVEPKNKWAKKLLASIPKP
jgi:hypothetical protein